MTSDGIEAALTGLSAARCGYAGVTVDRAHASITFDRPALL